VQIERASSFRGRFALPGDKSISHRAAILGAMAEGETRVRNYSSAADCASTLACLAGLGVEVRRQGADVAIAGHGLAAWRPPSAVLDAGNSGSTIRMLAGALAGRPFRAVLDGDESLRRRPVERVAAPLRAMGASVLTTDGRPPLAVFGGPLKGLAHDLPVASAQVKTAILLAGLQAEGTTSVREPSPSRDHTERMLPLFGASVERDGLVATVRGGARLRGTEVVVPGDASSAAFLVVAALVLPDSEVRLDGVLLSPTRTAFIGVLRAMGGSVETRLAATLPEPVGSIVACSSRLHGTTIDPAIVPSLIDEVPALAAAAAFAEGPFTVTGAAELRIKESDRISALAEGLSALGARVRELPDGLVIEGGARLRGARVRSHGDHRIAMALSVAALAAEGRTEVEDAECVAVSFPGFYSLLDRATGRA
jgi:3-phosphoshikimate 1-carboxyvinyltransferase